jgi:hypothetical protein
MKAVRALLGVIALSASFSAASQNLVLNSSFETGTTASWVQTNPGGVCVFDVLTGGAPSTGAGNWTTPAAAQGTRVFMGDTNAPGTCSLHQDIAIPAAGSYSLRFAAGYNYQDFGDPTGAGCSATIGIETTGGVPIATYYAAAGGVNQPMVQRGPFLLPPAVSGTTVRVIMTMVSCGGGPAGIPADNFVLAAGIGGVATVPTMSQWALILMALLMAATALVALRRR